MKWESLKTLINISMEIDNNLLKQIKITPILDSLKLEDISDTEYFSKKYSK